MSTFAPTLTHMETSFTNGELAGSATALQMPSVVCSYVIFKGHPTNTGNVYIGSSSVTVANGTTDTTTGMLVAPGEQLSLIPVPGGNLNAFYRICDNATDDLVYMTFA